MGRFIRNPANHYRDSGGRKPYPSFPTPEAKRLPPPDSRKAAVSNLLLGFGITSAPEVVRTVPVLLLAILILALGGCGGGDTSSDEGEATSETGSENAAPAETGEEATSARTGEAIPADVLSITVGLIPNEDSSVSGTAILTDVSGGLEVSLNLQDLPGQSGAEHPAHIHEGGACVDSRMGNSAPVGYPLETVITEQDGTGSSTAFLPGITVVQLFSGAPKYLDVHGASTGDDVPPTVSCADIYTTTGGD